MSKSYWRDQAAPIIERVLKEMAGKPEKEIRKALHDAYPFGPREYHPYKIWLDEIKKQRGGRPAPIFVEDTRRAWFQVTEERNRKRGA